MLVKQLLQSIPLCLFATLLEAQVACEPAFFAMNSKDLPDEIAVENADALASVANAYGCNMPSFISEEVEVQYQAGEPAGKLQGYLELLVDGSPESGFWVVGQEGVDTEPVAVPSSIASLDMLAGKEPTLRLSQFAAAGLTSVEGIPIDGNKLGYVATDQLLAVSAGFWPSNRYTVTFVSEPKAGLVHRGTSPREATEWTVIIDESALPNYRIVSSDNEVCRYEDAEIRISKRTGSATFLCRFKQE